MLGLVLEGVGQVEAVVVDHEGQPVVLQLDGAELEGGTGHVGAERVVQVVEVHPQVLQVPFADGKPA